MFQKQPIMRKVLYSLVPLFLFSVYLYGWRALLIPLVVFPVGIFAELWMEKAKGKGKAQVTEAVLVTSALYSLSLPPGVPIWIAVLGILFAVVFGKMVFGGFGRNIYNPAITGRLFAYLAFPGLLGTTWFIPGAAANWHWVTLIMDWLPVHLVRELMGGVDVITTATFMDVVKPIADQSAYWAGASLEATAKGIPENWLGAFLGFEPGSLGETSALLIALAGLYLIFTPTLKKQKDGTTKLEIQPTANWRMIVTTLVSAFAVMAAFYYWGPEGGKRLDPFLGLFSGSLLYVAVFMTTDPVSGPKKVPAQYVYGLLIGVSSALIRLFSGFPEGVSFGILIGNTFASLLDETIGKWGAKKPVAAPKVPAQEVKA